VAIDHWGEPRLKWEECVKEDAAIHLWCHNWKMTAQNRTFWRQDLWEAKSRLRVLVPWDGWIDIFHLLASHTVFKQNP